MKFNHMIATERDSYMLLQSNPSHISVNVNITMNSHILNMIMMNYAYHWYNCYRKILKPKFNRKKECSRMGEAHSFGNSSVTFQLKLKSKPMPYIKYG